MRYALYFVPDRADDLNEAGAGWLGRDAYDDRTFAQPEICGLQPWRVAELTLNARRYGFHATLKAPAPLAGHTGKTDYLGAVAKFCKSTPPVTIPSITIGRFGTIFALVPDQPFAPLNALEKSIVAHFEPWRGGLNDEALEKQRGGNLTGRQIEMLERWGYAFAVDEFRFHMTLTDRVFEPEIDAVVAAMNVHFSEFVGKPLAVNRLGVFVEDVPGAPFRILDSFALEGGG